jgi:1,4-alpha-glucan branching enzyme
VTPLDPVRHLLETWMPRQRWYPAKGRGVGVRDLGWVPLSVPGPPGDAPTAVEVHLLGLDSGDRLEVVQVPLSYRHAPLPDHEPALVGQVDHPRLGPRWVYDAPHDPDFVAALLAALERPAGRPPVTAPTGSHVLSGEQSNTSVIAEQAGAAPVIVKVFRTLHPGANPDVEVLAALDGSSQVPALVGWLGGTWRGPDGQQVLGHLAVATEFVADAHDAWREASAAVAAGEDFSARARSLGAATATLHSALAQAFGTTPADDAARAGLVDALRARLAWALRATHALDGHRAALGSWLDRLDLTDLPSLQRVHGDYHLGQVLHSASRGWVVLDFEGEPLRPLQERTRPDLALRDVAGMLRSFDYAAGQVRVATADAAVAAAADAWSHAARDAFCLGYADAAGHDPRERPDLLAALELDKALYEVAYEAGNRPAWIAVPLGAVTRLLS